MCGLTLKKDIMSVLPSVPMKPFSKIKKFGKNIPKDFVENLTNSIYERLSEVIRNNEGATDY